MQAREHERSPPSSTAPRNVIDLGLWSDWHTLSSICPATGIRLSEIGGARDAREIAMSTDLQIPLGDEAEPKKASRQILEHEIVEGIDALDRPLAALFISGLSAGLDIGFSLFLMAVVGTLMGGASEPAGRLLVANMYAIGFIFVVLGRSELFTEQTTLAVLPVLNRKATLTALARLWGVVYVANLLGAAAFAALAVKIGPALGVIKPFMFDELAEALTEHSGVVIFGSAVLAGWLMGLLSWLVAASRDTISQIFLVWLIATVIGLGRLHHIVVGTVEVLAGVFSGGSVTAADYGRFLLWTTLGNAAGGSFFVALIKYSYAIRGKMPH
jgi:formate-nitrite transporter family protein